MVDPAVQKSHILKPEVIAALIDRYDRAIRVTELQYLPVKLGFLVTTLVTAASLNLVYGFLAGSLTWLGLTLIMRPKFVVRLSELPISRFAPCLRRIPRWSFALLCVAYIWVATRPGGWDSWAAFALIWVLDASVSVIETRQIDSYVHWKEQISQRAAT